MKKSINKNQAQYLFGAPASNTDSNKKDTVKNTKSVEELANELIPGKWSIEENRW